MNKMVVLIAMVALFAADAGVCPSAAGQSGAVQANPARIDELFGDTLTIAAARFGTVNPNGAGDNSPAINAALAAGQPVFIPKGIYRVTKPIVLGNGQKLVCDGPATTQIFVDQAFDPKATGVIVGPHSEPGPFVQGCGILFAQPPEQSSRANFRPLGSCTSGAGGTGCQYPPAFDFRDAARFRLDHVKVAGAWDGVNATGNTGGHYINDLEIGALNVGIDIKGALDFCHWRGVHFWQFGFSGALGGVFGDGHSVAARLGRCDGLTISDFQSFDGQIRVLPDSSSLIINNLGLDNDPARFIVEPGGNATISINGAYTAAGEGSDAAIEIHSGMVIISGLQASGSSHAAQIDLFGGRTLIANSNLYDANPARTEVRVRAGAVAQLRDNFMLMVGGTHAAPFVQVDCGGVLDAQGNKWQSKAEIGGVAGRAVNVDCDDPRHVVANNDFEGWGFTLPAGAINGRYGANSGLAAFSFTPTVVIAGFTGFPGFAPVYTKQIGRYRYTGLGVEGDIRLQLDANAYAGKAAATGTVAVGGLPFSGSAMNADGEDGSTVLVKDSDRIGLGANSSQLKAAVQLSTRDAPFTSLIELREVGSGSPSRGLRASTGVPPGVRGWGLSLHFTIPRP